MTAPRMPPASAMVTAGLVGSADQLAAARESVSGLDRGHPQRALDLQVAGGISARLLPDRGLDLGAAWFDGVPLGWLSRVGEVFAGTAGDGSWTSRFGGGLVTTCGLQNVGAASEGYPQHGAFSATPAADVRVERRTATGEELELVVAGRVEEVDALDVHLRCDRRWTTRTGEGLITLSDTVTNLGHRSLPAPMLYHVNLGAPLWSPGAEVRVPAGTRTLPRDADADAWVQAWEMAPEPTRDGAERVFEHVLAAGDSGRWPEVAVVSERLGLTVCVSWDCLTMPRLHQWVHPRAGVYVLGIEPANCSVLGRAADRATGRLPYLEAGESRTSSLRISVQRTAAPAGQEVPHAVFQGLVDDRTDI